MSKKLSSYKKNNARRQDNKDCMSYQKKFYRKLSEHSNEPDLSLKLPEAVNIKQ
jgi:hypothetical protein